MVIEKRILILDFANYVDYPIGGYLSFARSMIETFGNTVALVGIATSPSDPVGRWFIKEIDGTPFDFFAFARYKKTKTRHLLPDRLVSYPLVRYYGRKIYEKNINNIFLQRQEILMALPGFKSKNVCFCFAGLENPLSISKYSYASFIAKWFERAFFKRVRFVNTILAAGDSSSIGEMIARSGGRLSQDQVIKFPTRINTSIFRPVGKDYARGILNLPPERTIFVTTGRVATLKGWKFMVDCFVQFEKSIQDSVLYFIGEGEDEEKLKQYIYVNNLSEKIFLAGRKTPEEVVLYLNASDLFIMGSYKEGWSTSLIEAIACGVPACVTDFSSAREIIVEGVNGYVVSEHNSDRFVKAMTEALKIRRPVNNANVKLLSSDLLKGELLKYWKLI